MRIDCTDCAMYGSDHCHDCLVTALLHPPTGPVDIDAELDPPLEALAGAGLIPALKFRPRDTAERGHPQADSACR
ncbi:hypothetical protein BH24ACT26_BH24ACT26_01740 [soil metagenome]